MKNLKRIADFLTPYRWIAVLLVISVILPVGMELVVPKALNFIIDEGIQVGNMQAIWQGTQVMLASALIGALATLGQGVCRALLSQGLAYDMRNRLFSHIQTLSFANLDKIQTGELMTRLSSDVDMVRVFFSHGLSLQLRALTMVIGSIVMMFVIHWQLASIMLILLPIAAVLIIGLMNTARPLFMTVQEKLSVLNTAVQENLAGVAVVKAFVMEKFEIKNFHFINQGYKQENIKVGRLMAVALPSLTFLTNLGIVAVLWFGGLNIDGGLLSLGELVAFTNYVMIGMAPLMMLGNALTLIARAEASAERFFRVLDSKPAVSSVADAHKVTTLNGGVRFENVTFRYDLDGDSEKNGMDREHRGGRKVLEGVTLSVKAGQRVALLGATGSGKSSLVNLIPRFYDVESGQIFIDQLDIRYWELDSLRKKIGVVLQDTTLFSGSIRENIAYGRPAASLDEVIRVSKIAQAHDFIMAMPEGYDSLVEERGVNLSGGQKQRVAIARALLVKPRILILDDSTSAVDMETEARIQSAMDSTLLDCTVFIVAQRISSVINADQILVLEHGRIIAQGDHQSLIVDCPIYQEIYHTQTGIEVGGSDE